MEIRLRRDVSWNATFPLGATGQEKLGARHLPIPEAKPFPVMDLQAGSVDHLVVHHQLATTIVDDQGANAATAILERLTDAAEEVTLGHDGQTLLDVTGLGHGDDAAIVTQVQDAVGLVDGAEHGLDHNGRRGVGDEAGLLVQLAGEEVDTQVAVLAGLGGDGDTDHLAGTALEDQDVADAHEVAGDGHGLGGGAAASTGLDNAHILTNTVPETNWSAIVSSDDNILTVVVIMMVMVMVVMVMERVHDAVGSAFHTTTEGVVVTVVVVVAHLASRGVINHSLGLVNLEVGGRGRSGSNGLYVEVATAVGVSAVGVDGLGLEAAVVRDVGLLGAAGRAVVDLGVGGTVVGGTVEGEISLGPGRTVVGVVGRVALAFVRLYGGTLRAAVVGEVDVVGGVGTTTIFTLSDVELGLKSLIVDRRAVLEADRGFTVAKGGVSG